MNAVIEAFKNGKAKQMKNDLSTGAALYYHNNMIAKWENGKLWVSNGGYVHYTRKGNEVTGSKTTKERLNELPGVRLWQKNCRWYLNGQEWNGDFIQVDINAPEVKDSGNYFNLAQSYKPTDGWRGYSQPDYAVCGANDTGMWEDSPCRSDIAEKELNEVVNLLNANGIKTKLVTCESSNVFCVHHYIVPKVKDYERAKELIVALDIYKFDLLYTV